MEKAAAGGEEFTQWLQTFQPDALIFVSPREYHWLAGLPDGVARPPAALLLRPSDPTQMPEVSGFTRHSQAIGRLAAESLEQSIRLRQTGFRDYPVLISVPPLWIEGKSFSLGA